jgi:hypothetical protein
VKETRPVASPATYDPDPKQLHRDGRAPVTVLRDPRLSAQSKGFFATLQSYAGEDGCRPSQQTLSVAMGCSSDTIERWCRELEALGYLARKPRHDSRGMQVGVRYFLYATSRMLEERARRSVVNGNDYAPRTDAGADLARMRVPTRHGCGPGPRTDADQVRICHDQGSSEQETPKPLSGPGPDGGQESGPLAPACAGDGNDGHPDKARNRAERKELGDARPWIGHHCNNLDGGGCGIEFTGVDNVIRLLPNGERVAGIVVLGYRQIVRDINHKASEIFVAQAAVHFRCK